MGFRAYPTAPKRSKAYLKAPNRVLGLGCRVYLSLKPTCYVGSHYKA